MSDRGDVTPSWTDGSTTGRPSVYRPGGEPGAMHPDEAALAQARRAALREREALRQQRPLVWPPPPEQPGGPGQGKKAKKGLFGRRKPTVDPLARPMSRPEVQYESAGPSGPLPAYGNFDARLQATENVRRGQSAAFTVEGGTVEPATGSRKRKRGSALAGGRWRRIALTSVMTVALVVLIVNGLYRLAGKALYDAPQPPAGSGYPVAAASGYAARFGQAYLTWDQSSPQSRADALRVFFPDSRGNDFGWDGAGRQSLLGPPVISGVTAHDDSHAVVHLAANLNPGGWTCMDVSVYAANGGAAFAITSYLAFIACPPVAVASLAVPQHAPENDRVFAESIRQTLETFLRAYAASAPEIAQSTTQDSGIYGLGGLVSFVELSELDTPSVADPSADVRQADIQVRWRLPSGGSLLQSYRLTLHQIGGRWFVAQILGGVEDPNIAPKLGGVPTTSAKPQATASPTGSPGQTPTQSTSGSTSPTSGTPPN